VTHGFNRVLVATDFQLDGDRAIRRAGRLPLFPNATLILIHVLPTDLAAAVIRGAAEQTLDVAAAKLASLLARRGRRDVMVRTHLARGDAGSEIARAAQANAAEMVVVGRGRSRLSGTFLGSTAQRVARQARMPVLLVRQPAVAPYRRVVLGLTHSPDALGAAKLTLRVIGGKGTVFVVHAYHDPRADLAPTLVGAVAKARWRAFAPQLAEQSRRVRRLLGVVGPAARRWSLSFKGGDPRRRLLEAVATKRAEVLVVGSRSRSGLARLVLGSVAEAVLNRAPCDVLISPRRRWLA
jgi:nucleotide-binding universal stress UspA family protein